MPHTPDSINQAIRNAEEPRKKGEEGILHPIKINKQRYFAKEWRGKHNEHQSLAYEDDSKRAVASPFWHKVKYYEGVLLSAAFPEQTLRVNTAFDPRINKADSGELKLTYDQGRPVTLTKAVESGSDAQRRRDNIIDRTYEEYLPEFSPDNKGILRTANPFKSKMKIIDTDIKMRQEFGEGLSTDNFDRQHPRESLLRMAREIKKKHPKSTLADMYASGLLPSHPEFNFIPTQETTAEDGPRGIFIEVEIADLDLLHQKLLSNCQTDKDRAQVERRIKRYKLYRSLDEIYDTLFVSHHYESAEPSLRDDHDVVNEVWKTLEVVRTQIDKNKKINLMRVQGELYYLLEEESSKTVLLEKIKAFQSELERS